MVSSKNVQSVLRMISAGKDPQPVPPQQPAAVDDSYVIYFYYAPEDKAIDFKNIERDLKNPAKSKALVEKLKSPAADGVTPYSAGYFSWKRVAVATNKYDKAKKSYIVYHADVDSMGTIVPGSEKIEPAVSYPTTDQVKEEFNLFKNGILNLQTSSPDYEVSFLNGEPQDNFVKQLLANPKLAKQGEPYNTFARKLDQFRIWTTNGLVRPDFRKSNTDGLQGGYYPGGKDAFEKMILPLVKNQPEEAAAPGPSLKDKQETQKPPQTNSRFSPAPQTTEPVQGEYLDTLPRGEKMANVNKSARNVVIAYLKNSAYGVTQPGTMPQQTPQQTNAPIVFPLGKTVQQSMKNKQNMEKAIDLQKQQEKLVQQTTQPQTKTVTI